MIGKVCLLAGFRHSFVHFDRTTSPMSRRRSRDAASPAAPPSLRGRRPWLPLVIAAVVVVAAGGLIYADWHSTIPEDTHATYVGRQTCIQCHQQQADAFHNSHHDLAMDHATPESVLGDFSGVELEHDGIVSRMYKDGERFMIRTEGPDGEMGDFEVKYTLGVDPLQNYMVEFDRAEGQPDNEIARLQVLRVSWDTRQKKWFYLPAPDVHEKLAPDDELHWTGVAQRWNTMCADCHSTNVQKNYNDQTQRYHTTFSEIDVSCEACHGPGSTHVELANSFSLFWDRKLGKGLKVNLKGSLAEPQVSVCAECHARRQTLTADYDPGDNYWDHYATELLTDLTYHPDGQIEDEVFEHGSYLQSKMYHKNVRCTDCHDPHSARLKHEGNKLCTSCHQHPEGKYDTPLHHHHVAGSRGASCVECHMPVTNYMEVHGRRDHSIRVPRPDLSVDLGTPNACTNCHLDQAKLREAVREAGGSTNPDHLKQYLHFVQAARRGDKVIADELQRLDTWAVDALEKWYGKRPQKRDEPEHFAYALAAARRQEPGAGEKLAKVVGDKRWPAIVRATALAEWGNFPSEEMYLTSHKQLNDNHPLVRTAAVANLSPLPPSVRAKALAPLLHDPDFVVRRLAARMLADAAGELKGRDRNALQLTLKAWVDGMLANNDRAGAHLAIGDLQLQLRDYNAAEHAYRRAIAVEPQAMGPRMQLAALLEAMAADGLIPAEEHASVSSEVARLREEEFALLKRDYERAPNLAMVQFRYGRELLGRGEFQEALAPLARAVELEPNNVEYRLVYAEGLRRVGQTDQAVEQVDAALKLRPQDEDILQFRDQLRPSPLPKPQPTSNK